MKAYDVFQQTFKTHNFLNPGLNFLILPGCPEPSVFTPNPYFAF
jgi:hypothetical protein